MKVKRCQIVRRKDPAHKNERRRLAAMGEAAYVDRLEAMRGMLARASGPPGSRDYLMRHVRAAEFRIIELRLRRAKDVISLGRPSAAETSPAGIETVR